VTNFVILEICSASDYSNHLATLQPNSQTSLLQHLDALVASRESLTLPSEIV
jgi:hypothetical protein